MNMNVMAFQDLLVMTFENCSKIYGYLIHYLLRKLKEEYLGPSCKLKALKM
jgi:hypothetical protein